MVVDYSTGLFLLLYWVVFKFLFVCLFDCFSGLCDYERHTDSGVYGHCRPDGQQSDCRLAFALPKGLGFA